MEEDEVVVIADRVEDHFQMMDVMCQKVDEEHIPAEDTTQKIEGDTMDRTEEGKRKLEDENAWPIHISVFNIILSVEPNL